MEITFLGACQEVGRAGFLVEDGNSRVLLDYGLKINGRAKTPLPVTGFLDGIILSHSHLDHSGYIPALYKYTEAPCFMTPPTISFVDMLIKDAMKVTRLRRENPLYTQANVKRMMRNTVPVKYNRKCDVGEMEFELHDAGHIVGAASMRLSGKHELVYTGDIKLEKTRLHEGADWPYKDIDILITESTYGGREHPPRHEIENEFVSACLDVLDEDRIVLAPSFAVNRSQEVAEVLHAHNFDYPVFIDGMAKQASEITIDFPSYVRDFREMYSTLKWVRWVHNYGTRRRAMNEPAVIISPAGMLTGGPAVNYLLRLKETRGAVFFTGYQPAGCPGQKLLETKKFRYGNYNLDYSDIDIRRFDFSAHAGRSDLEKIIKRANPSTVFLVHGDPDQTAALASWVQAELGCNTFIPRFGEKVNIDKYV